MSSTSDYLLPRIYVGDINSDGYPDILVTIKYNNGSSIPQILLNKEMPHSQVPTTGLSDVDFDKIDKETIDQKNILVKNRYFDLNVTSNDYHQVLFKYQNAKLAFFTDLIENSMLDMIVVSNFPTGIGMAVDGSPLPEFSAIYNNLLSDSFFVKSRMLTDEKISSPVK